MMMMMNDIVREASELFGSLNEQLAILGGIWPKVIKLEGRIFKFNHKGYSSEGELEAVIYVSADGAVLTVLND